MLQILFIATFGILQLHQVVAPLASGKSGKVTDFLFQPIRDRSPKNVEPIPLSPPLVPAVEQKNAGQKTKKTVQVVRKKSSSLRKITLPKQNDNRRQNQSKPVAKKVVIIPQQQQQQQQIEQYQRQQLLLQKQQKLAHENQLKQQLLEQQQLVYQNTLAQQRMQQLQRQHMQNQLRQQIYTEQQNQIENQTPVINVIPATTVQQRIVWPDTFLGIVQTLDGLDASLRSDLYKIARYELKLQKVEEVNTRQMIGVGLAQKIITLAMDLMEKEESAQNERILEGISQLWHQFLRSENPPLPANMKESVNVAFDTGDVELFGHINGWLKRCFESLNFKVPTSEANLKLQQKIAQIAELWAKETSERVAKQAESTKVKVDLKEEEEKINKLREQILRKRADEQKYAKNEQLIKETKAMALKLIKETQPDLPIDQFRANSAKLSLAIRSEISPRVDLFPPNIRLSDLRHPFIRYVFEATFRWENSNLSSDFSANEVKLSLLYMKMANFYVANSLPGDESKMRLLYNNIQQIAKNTKRLAIWKEIQGELEEMTTLANLGSFEDQIFAQNAIDSAFKWRGIDNDIFNGLILLAVHSRAGISEIVKGIMVLQSLTNEKNEKLLNNDLSSVFKSAPHTKIANGLYLDDFRHTFVRNSYATSLKSTGELTTEFVGLATKYAQMIGQKEYLSDEERKELTNLLAKFIMHEHGHEVLNEITTMLHMLKKTTD